MENSKDSVTLRGVVITRETIQERYNCVLNDTEWLIFKTAITKSWKEDEAEIRRLVFKHLKGAFEKLDYKLELRGKDLIFTKR